MRSTRPLEDKNNNNRGSTAHLHAMLQAASESEIPQLVLYADKPSLLASYDPYQTSPPVEKKTIAPIAQKKRPYNLPVKNMELILTAEHKKQINDVKSFHVVLKININGELWFVKMNKPKSPMSAIEAGIGEICSFYIDELSAPGVAFYRKTNGLAEYFASGTKALPNFKSLNDDPLTEKDLSISVLEKKLLTIEQLDELDESLAHRDLKTYYDPGVKIHGRVPVEDLINYRKLKTLATILELDHFVEEDDGHKGNIGNGDFDRDNKAIEVVFDYKESDTIIGMITYKIDWSFRNPTGKFPVSVHDLENSPDLKDDKRFIWCNRTDPYPKVIESIREILKKLLSTDTNAYTPKDNKLFIALKNHPVYQFHKNKMFLRFILHNPKVYSHLLALHLSPTFTPTIDGKVKQPHRDLTALFERRQKEYKRELLKSLQFSEFLEKHGDYALRYIERKYNKYNAAMLPEIEKHKDEVNPGFTPELLVPTADLRKNYQDLVAEIKEKQKHAVLTLPDDTFAPARKMTM